MKAQLAVFAMTAILIVGIGTAPAFGQILGAIDVSTDKESYMTGDTIVVSGTIRDNYNTDITMRIIAPEPYGTVSIDQITPTADKTYQTEVAIGGIFKFSGTYTVEVTYGSKDRTSSTTFDVVVVQDTMEPEPTPVDTPSVFMIEGVEDGIQYSITGGTLKSIVPDPDTNSLIVMIEAVDDGSLTMTIPKTILKAENADGTDSKVFIIIDGQEPDSFSEEVTQVDRTIVLEFSAGAEKIEIIGTWVIPEFGVIAAMILAVAIVSIIAISAKSRLSIIPRY